MFMYKLFDSIFFKKKLSVYNNANHYRDFSYIDDIVNSIYKLANTKKLFTNANVLNIGKGSSVGLKKILNHAEKITNKKPNISYVKMQPGDVLKTHSDIKNLKLLLNYKPKTDYKKGLENFLKWYKDYKRIK